MIETQPIYSLHFIDWQQSVSAILDASHLIEKLPPGKPVLLKPNLVEAMLPPITTPVELIAAIINYIQTHSPETVIIVGEGCGSLSYDTFHSYRELGYTAMAQQTGIELLDLNEAPLLSLNREDCRRWPKMHLPLVAFESFLLSVPVLKAHSLAGITLTMKNMMGLAPPKHYQQGGHWKKASFHDRIHEAILDLNRYRTPDFTLLDATVGMQEAHLWGPTCSPPPNLLAASFDPVAIDAYGADLLGKSWRRIDHLSKAHNELGFAEPLQIVRVGENAE
jgi:uncharacterized protein (DUF362 family)